MGLTVDDIGVHTLSFILYGLSGDSVRQGTSSDIFSCSKRTEQQALVTWTAFELESYIVQRVSIAASSSLPYLQVKPNLSYTPT